MTVRDTIPVIPKQMSSKDVIAQEVLAYEAMSRVSKLLDQFVDGLRNLGVLKAMRSFPDLFVHLFTYTANVSTEEVLDTLRCDAVLEPSDAVIFNHLKRFIVEGSEDGM